MKNWVVCTRCGDDDKPILSRAQWIPIHHHKNVFPLNKASLAEIHSCLSSMFNSLSLIPSSSFTHVYKKSCCSDNGTINQFDQYEKWHLELISKNIYLFWHFFLSCLLEGVLVKLLHALWVKYYVEMCFHHHIFSINALFFNWIIMHQ